MLCSLYCHQWYINLNPDSTSIADYLPHTFYARGSWPACFLTWQSLTGSVQTLCDWTILRSYGKRIYIVKIIKTVIFIIRTVILCSRLQRLMLQIISVMYEASLKKWIPSSISIMTERRKYNIEHLHDTNSKIFWEIKDATKLKNKIICSEH